MSSAKVYPLHPFQSNSISNHTDQSASNGDGGKIKEINGERFFEKVNTGPNGTTKCITRRKLV